MKNELLSILVEPFYLECCMRRVPMVPLKPNLRTMAVWISVFFYILISQSMIILPRKCAQSHVNLFFVVSNSLRQHWPCSCISDTDAYCLLQLLFLGVRQPRLSRACSRLP